MMFWVVLYSNFTSSLLWIILIMPQPFGLLTQVRTHLSLRTCMPNGYCTMGQQLPRSPWACWPSNTFECWKLGCLLYKIYCFDQSALTVINSLGHHAPHNILLPEWTLFFFSSSFTVKNEVIRAEKKSGLTPQNLIFTVSLKLID